MTSKATNTRILYLSIENLPYYSLNATGLILASLNSPTVCTLSIPHTLSPSLFTINNSMEFIASRPFHPPATTIALKRREWEKSDWKHQTFMFLKNKNEKNPSTERFDWLSSLRQTPFYHSKRMGASNSNIFTQFVFDITICERIRQHIYPAWNTIQPSPLTPSPWDILLYDSLLLLSICTSLELRKKEGKRKRAKSHG